MTFEISLKPIQFNAANGDRFEVFPQIENPTNNEATDTVELLVGGTVRSSREFTLSGGGQQEAELVWTVDVTEDAELDVTVRTSSDSASDEAAFLLFNDTIRIRFDYDGETANIFHEETFVEDTTKTGAGAE